MPLQNVFSTYRPLLKLAVEHDANHLLHFLLPCSISGQPLCCDTSTVSLVNKLRERFRSLSPINESDTRDDPRQIWRTLHLNLHRRKNWSASLAIRAETSVCDSRDSPNFDWFRRRMDSRAGLELGAAEMRRVGEQTELDVLDSMLQVGCRPTATVYLQALEQLSERHGAFPLTLDAFWRWEMYGAADGRTADHSEEIATALVRSALLDEGSGASDGRPAPPSWRHPVGVWRALVETAGALPSERATNQLLRRLGSLGAHCKSTDEAQEIARAAAAVTREASRHSSAVTASAYKSMIGAFSRAGDMQAAFDCAVGLVSRGGSIPAEASLELLEWAAEEGDRDKAAFLEEELAATGKASYLAAINSPSC